MRSRYEPLALGAPDAATFYRFLNQMLGELGQSHLEVAGPGVAAQPGLRPRGAPAAPAARRIPASCVRIIEGRPTVTLVRPQSSAERAGLRAGLHRHPHRRLAGADGGPGRSAPAPGRGALLRPGGGGAPAAGADRHPGHRQVPRRPGPARRGGARARGLPGEAGEAGAAAAALPGGAGLAGRRHRRAGLQPVPQRGGAARACRAPSTASGRARAGRWSRPARQPRRPGRGGHPDRRPPHRPAADAGDARSSASSTRCSRPPRRWGSSPSPGPLVIVTDEGTASTAEILAAGLKEAGRAVVVGRHARWGRCCPRRSRRCPAGPSSSTWWRTFAHPKGVLLEGRGVQPDRRVHGDPGRPAGGPGSGA